MFQMDGVIKSQSLSWLQAANEKYATPNCTGILQISTLMQYRVRHERILPRRGRRLKQDRITSKLNPQKKNTKRKILMTLCAESVLPTCVQFCKENTQLGFCALLMSWQMIDYLKGTGTIARKMKFGSKRTPNISPKTIKNVSYEKQHIVFL